MKTITVRTKYSGDVILKQDGEYCGFRVGDIVKVNNLDATFTWAVKEGNAVRVDNNDATFNVGIVVGFQDEDGKFDLPPENKLKTVIRVWFMEEAQCPVYFAGQHARKYLILIERSKSNAETIGELELKKLLDVYIKNNSM